MNTLISFDKLQTSKDEVFMLLQEFDDTVDYNIQTFVLSAQTKRILKHMVVNNYQDKVLKKFALSLDDIFYDEVFDHFLKISKNEQDKFLELLSVRKKKKFKPKIYQKLLLNYNHIEVKKMVYLLSDTYKPNAMKIKHEIFSHIIENPDLGYSYMKSSQMNGFFNFYKLIDPTLQSSLAIKLIKSSLFQSCKDDYITSESDMLINFLINNFMDDEGARFGMHYIKSLDPKCYDSKIINFVINCKNNIQNKYKDLAAPLDDLLYDIYEYALNHDRYADIINELAMTLTNKMISEAFGDDDRSLFWKQYTNSITEPIIFVRYPIVLFMMKFKNVGIVEYIETGNATYLYSHEQYEIIKNRILSSASISKNTLNIQSMFNPSLLKTVTKTGLERYIHRGNWKKQFRYDMRTKYKIIAGFM